MCKRGDIYYADLGGTVDCRISGTRPVLIVSNDIVNKHSQVITVIPMTTKLKKKYIPTHIVLHPHDSGLRKPSMILAEQVRSLDKSSLRSYAGHISEPTIMETISYALAEQLSSYVKLTRN